MISVPDPGLSGPGSSSGREQSAPLGDLLRKHRLGG